MKASKVEDADVICSVSRRHVVFGAVSWKSEEENDAARTEVSGQEAKTKCKVCKILLFQHITTSDPLSACRLSDVYRHKP